MVHPIDGQGHEDCPGCVTLRREKIARAILQCFEKDTHEGLTRGLVLYALDMKNPLPAWCK